MTLILSNEEIGRLLNMHMCLDILEELYREYGQGNTVHTPVGAAIAPSQREGVSYALKTMSGIVPYLGKAAIRLNSDILHYPVIDGISRRVKIPAASGQKWVGLVLLFDATTGEPVAIFPDGVVQRMRVGGTSGLAAKYLSRQDSSVVALIGSGWQAGSQVMALCAVRKVKEIRVYSPNAEHRSAFCREMESRLQLSMIPAESAEAAVRDADIVAAATSSIIPVIRREWATPGVHLSAIKLHELSWDVVTSCDRFFFHTNRDVQHTNYWMDSDKNLPGGAAKQWWVERIDEIKVKKRFPDLGDLVAGKIPGRTNPEEVTGFMNNLGLGIQFAAVGARLYDLAREHGMGHEVPTDWFLESVHP